MIHDCTNELPTPRQRWQKEEVDPSSKREELVGAGKPLIWRRAFQFSLNAERPALVDEGPSRLYTTEINLEQEVMNPAGPEYQRMSAVYGAKTSA
jgi:hypothetical protein